MKKRLKSILLGIIAIDIVFLILTELVRRVENFPFAHFPGDSLDVILRPIILLGLAFLAYQALQAVSPAYRRAISIALVLSAMVEAFQSLDVINPDFKLIFMALATAAFYAFYCFAFFNAVEVWNARSIAPFLILALYGIIMLFALRVPLKLLPSAGIYLALLILMVGLAFQRPLQSDYSSSSFFAAAGAAMLLASDSLRSVAEFKFSGDFAFSEPLIMTLYFSGQYAIARSTASE